MNFTDVDDRTIVESQKAGVPLREYTDRFIAAFREDAAALGLEPVEDNPRATDDENLRAMAEHDRGARAARAHLPQRRLDLLPASRRCRSTASSRASTTPASSRAPASTATSTRRRTRATSCSGRPRKPGEPTWDFGVGPGRPGWHIECSAMALRLLGPAPSTSTAAASTSIFPHHENEIAQSRGRHRAAVLALLVPRRAPAMDDGEKMSKSLGNVFTVRDILKQGLSARRRCATC